METPKTYKMYDKDNQYIGTATAADANKQVNPNEIKIAAENLKQVAYGQMQIIRNALYDVANDAELAIVVNSASMGPIISGLADALMNVHNSIAKLAGGDEAYNTALKEHDRIQRLNNEKAKRDALASPNCDHIQ